MNTQTWEERCCWSWRDVAENLARFEELDSPWTSCHRIAGQLEVPGRTLHYWIRRKRAMIRDSSSPPDVVGFFESPHGLDFLHQLLTAAHLVFVQGNDCGIRNLGYFLELSGLDEFIAPSYGAQRAVAEEIKRSPC